MSQFLLGVLLAALGLFLRASPTGSDLSIFADAFARLFGTALIVLGLAFAVSAANSWRKARKEGAARHL